jgi:hypothetical protein
MENVEGSPTEKEAAYKIIKGKLFNAYNSQYSPLVDSAVQNHIQPVLAKVSAEQLLVNMAQDSARYTEAMNKLLNEIKKYPDLSSRQTLEVEPTTILARYAALRMASNLLYEAWIIYPHIPHPEDIAKEEALQLAFAKLENREEKIKNLIHTHKTEKKFIGLAKAYYNLLLMKPLSKQFTDKALDDASEFYGKQRSKNQYNPEPVKAFIEIFSPKGPINRQLVNDFIQTLEKKGFEEAAKWVKEYWASILKRTAQYVL